jgi:hypothetical protein
VQLHKRFAVAYAVQATIHTYTNNSNSNNIQNILSREGRSPEVIIHNGGQIAFLARRDGEAKEGMSASPLRLNYHLKERSCFKIGMVVYPEAASTSFGVTT